MIFKLILALAVIAVFFVGMARYRRQSPAAKKKTAIKAAIYAAIVVLLLMLFTGHLHWLSALITGIVTAIVGLVSFAARSFPLWMHVLQQRRPKSTANGKQSTVQSEYLKIVLDHDSETMQGEVINGPHAGSNLTALSKTQLRELLAFYDQHDRDSLELLSAFIARLYPEDTWEHTSQRQAGQQPSTSAMTRQEALEILGLSEGATDKEIKKAHKQLMQRLHPDRGGSQYLAARVNQAKDFLLKKRK